MGKIGVVTERQLEVFLLTQKGLSQNQISKTLSISQGRVSEILKTAKNKINESVETVNFLNTLRKVDYDNMDMENVLKVMRERHEEATIRGQGLQGTIKPYPTKGEKLVFTIGYEKRKIDGFVKILKGNGVDILIDLRANGHSRKPGFSNGTLKKTLEKNGIDYLAMKELGSPKELREGLKEKGHGWFFTEYRKYLNNEVGEVDKLEKIAKYSRGCLMCFELEPRDCHRSIVASKLEDRGFEIAHL
jgi:DNA-binding CsgD family transcriptional regulator